MLFRSGFKVTPESFLSEIAPARSFFATPFPHKAEWQSLREDYPALLPVRRDHGRSLMIDYTSEAYVTPLRKANEPARHKLLDLVGDLALVGVPVAAYVYAYKPHHALNRRIAELLYGQLCGEELV